MRIFSKNLLKVIDFAPGVINLDQILRSHFHIHSPGELCMEEKPHSGSEIAKAVDG